MIARLALEDRAAGVFVADHATALRADRLAIGGSPTDVAEHLLGLVLRHARPRTPGRASGP